MKKNAQKTSRNARRGGKKLALLPAPSLQLSPSNRCLGICVIETQRMKNCCAHALKENAVKKKQTSGLSVLFEMTVGIQSSLHQRCESYRSIAALPAAVVIRHVCSSELACSSSQAEISVL
jgi:hypothetical protein